VLTNNDA
jgi:hypothetical protein